MDKSIAKLIEFGQGGHTVYFGPGHTQSGYCSPDNFCTPYHWWADPPGKMSTSWDSWIVPPDGVPVIDVTKAVETAVGYKWVFHGPMLNPDLEDGEIDAMPEVSPIMLPAVAAYGQMGTMIQTQEAHKRQTAGGLDSVSTAQYIRGWREHGARIGTFRVQDGQGRIEWE